ncbi:MAG: serine hydrolase [Marmoricola sp.]|nr:serine hydrolase [Marmoricola sp.]
MELPDLSPAGPGEAWSVCVLDARTGAELAAVDPDRTLGTASVAKVFALVELARRLEDGSLDPSDVLDRRNVVPVGDSGLWQHLRVDRLPVVDVAALVGATSDNLATNVLLGLLELEHVQRTATDLAPGGSTLHDLVRDHRGPGDPPTLSSGCARDWALVFAGLHRGEVVSRGVSARVLGWTAANTDLSLVASAFGLDPLAHAEPDLGLRLWNKTGTDAGTRADVGLVARGEAAVAYAVLCGWDDAHEPAARRRVLERMRAVGAAILDQLDPPSPRPSLRRSGGGPG